MILLAAGVLATVVLATIGAIAAGVISLKIAVPLLAGCVLGWIWLYKRDRRRLAEEARTADAEVQSRLRDLSARASAPGFEMRVEGPTNLAIPSVLGLVGAFALLGELASAKVAIPVVAVYVLIMAVAGLSLLAAIPGIGKPKLTLTRSGFASPLTPFVPWEDVDGVFLQKIPSATSRGMPQYVLSFRIPTLRQNISRYGLFYRLPFPLRSAAKTDQLGVILKDTTEHPEVAYGLARLLWTGRTGRSYDWNPYMSAEYNAALRQVADAARHANSPQAFDQLLSRDPREARAVLDAFEQGSKTMVREARRQLRWLHWLFWASIVATVFYLATRVLR
jgi:hypothetical protein